MFGKITAGANMSTDKMQWINGAIITQRAQHYSFGYGIIWWQIFTIIMKYLTDCSLPEQSLWLLIKIFKSTLQSNFFENFREDIEKVALIAPIFYLCFEFSLVLFCLTARCKSRPWSERRMQSRAVRFLQLL